MYPYVYLSVYVCIHMYIQNETIDHTEIKLMVLVISSRHFGGIPWSIGRDITSKCWGLKMWDLPWKTMQPSMGNNMGMDKYLLIPFLMGWTSIYQLFWGSLGTRVLTHPHMMNHGNHVQFPILKPSQCFNDLQCISARVVLDSPARYRNLSNDLQVQRNQPQMKWG